MSLTKEEEALANKAMRDPHCLPVGKIRELAALVRKLQGRVEELEGACRKTLDLADRLNAMAEGGAGFAEHWGSRVLQTVRHLRALARPGDGGGAKCRHGFPPRLCLTDAGCDGPDDLLSAFPHGKGHQTFPPDET